MSFKNYCMVCMLVILSNSGTVLVLDTAGQTNYPQVPQVLCMLQVAATRLSQFGKKSAESKGAVQKSKNEEQQLGGMVTHQLKFQKLKNSTFDRVFPRPET